ncbi:MAG: hypothetical protein ACRC92_24140 [Peptostreptococcaceae bacterium]
MSCNLFKGFKTNKEERKVLLRYSDGSLIKDVSMVLLENECKMFVYATIRSSIIIATGWFTGKLVAMLFI